MTEFVEFAILGLPLGCVYALMAMGLVLTYKTSGVFHLAYAAQAFASARVYYELKIEHGWDQARGRRGDPRHLAGNGAVARAGAVPPPAVGGADGEPHRQPRAAGGHPRDHLGDPRADPTTTPPGLWPDGKDHLYDIGVTNLDGDQVAAILAAVISVVTLTAMFRWSSLGLRMRAVVESPRMAELNGIDADRINAVSWALSSVFAGLAGVLLGTFFPSGLQLVNFFTLLVAALAAAAFGRLSSIPLTFAGALLLGVTQQLLARYLPSDTDTWAIINESIRPSLPFIALFLLLLFWPGLRRVADPLAGVDPPPPPPAATDRPHADGRHPRPGRRRHRPRHPYAMFVMSDQWLNYVLLAVAYSTIFLSITVITGMAGLVSMGQATFAAIGAYTVAQLAENQGPGAAGHAHRHRAGCGRRLLALPVMRLEGIYLALATIAFALMFDNVIAPRSGWGGRRSPSRFPDR